MKRFSLWLALCCMGQVSAQSLSQADYVQFQNQATYLLTQDYYASFKTLATVSEGGTYEMVMSKMLTKLYGPSTKIWNDYTGQNTPFTAYVRDLRTQNRGSGAFRIEGTDYRRAASAQFVGRDSLTLKVYVQQLIRDVRGSRTTPVAITLVGRIGRDPQNQLGYFYNLRIGLVEKASPPADAVPFSADIQDKKNPFASYLAEQTLGVMLQKVTAELAKALPAAANGLNLTGFTYKGCGIHDLFSTDVLATLQTNLTNARQGLQVSTTDKTTDGYQIKGTYEAAGNAFRLSADLLNPAGGVVAHLDNTDLPLSWFAANQRTFIPVEYARTQTENKAIQPFVSDDRDLGLEINTGRTNAVFYKGEVMTLRVRTNKPAFVRALYRNVDNELIWLGDKKIEAGQANVDVELGRSACVSPFGVERLIVVASTDPMCALDVNPERAYQINIRKEPAETTEQAVNKALFEALANSGERKCTRGMVPTGTPYKAIRNIIITTKDKVL
ncbi:MAG: hypothetical protein EAZ91_15385 [Cytophagales bacterium]|nr:MAG: hypothetical protein EAZ91_15385 [Cytophagales bacterium]